MQEPAAATKLVLSGLKSGTDADRVRRALLAVPGVCNAEVFPAQQAAVVRHGAEVAVSQLILAVESAGLSARRALPGEGAGDYAFVPWGALRPEGRPLAAEESSCGVQVLLGLALVAAMAAIRQTVVRADHSAFAQFILGTVAQVVLGARYYAGAWRALARRRLDTEYLVALASSLVYAHGVVRVFGEHPARLHFDSAAAVLTLMTAGRWLELRVRWMCRAPLRAMVDLVPPMARVLCGGQEQPTLSCDLLPGDLVAVRPGERFPADGTVAEGRGAADESMLTGETLPAAKGPGDHVIGGTLNGSDRLVVRVERVGGEAALGRVVRTVDEAVRTRPTTGRLAERLAQLVVRGTLLAAAAAFLHAAARPGAEWDVLGAALLRAAAVLVAAAPRALLLAAPTAFAGAIESAAGGGVLVRSATTLERCALLRAVVFGRSGTITKGRPELGSFAAAAAGGENELLELAAGLTAVSPAHPLARELSAAARARSLQPAAVEDAVFVPGLGFQGRAGDGQAVVLGSRNFLRRQGIDPEDADPLAGEAEAAGRTALFLARGARVLGVLGFDDPVKPGASQAVADLERMGLSVYLLSGQSAAVARGTARAAGIDPDRVLADIVPEEQAGRLRLLRDRQGPLAAVGLGVGARRPLAAADVRMVLGGRAEPEFAGAQVALMGGDLRGVPRVIRIARRAAGGTRWCAASALLLNLGGMALAGLGLLPLAGAAALTVAGTVMVAAAVCRPLLRVPKAG